MTGPVFVDSNILVYRHDTAAPGKQALAASWMTYLWRSRRGRVSMQVLQEFYAIATQKLKPGIDRATARQEIQDLTAWRPVLINAVLLQASWPIQDRFGFSPWDSLIVAAAQASGCDVLLTEDLQHNQILDDLRVVNPFVEGPPPFLES